MVVGFDVSQNFNRQPIKHTVKSRHSRTMFCDVCNPRRMLVFHQELNRIVCPQCGKTPRIIEEKLAELEQPGQGPGQPQIQTRDGFESGGRPTNVSGMKMRAKFGPRSYSTIEQSEFGPIDSDTQQMLDENPSYRLVDYKETIPE